MKKLSIVCLAVVMAVVFGFTTVNADPSAKATAQIGSLHAVILSSAPDATDPDAATPGEDSAEDWYQIFEQVIKTPTGKDLFIDVSLECGLTTNTKVMSRALNKAVAEAEAVVKVQVLVDGVPVKVNGIPNDPSEIIFARRHQTLIAEFAGDFSTCGVEVDPDTGIGSIVITDECLDPESLQLILDTMQANSFNFIAPDLVAGEHTVIVMAKLSYMKNGYEVVPVGEDDDPQTTGAAAAAAYLGNGSVTIEVVRMIKDEDLVVEF